MAEPLEEQLLRAVVTALAAMTDVRPWGGEYPNPPKVTRDLVTIAGIPQFPFLSVYASAGAYTLGEEDGMTTGGSLGYDNRFSFLLTGFVQPTADVSADTWRLRLRKDALDTLASLTPPLIDIPQLVSLYPEGETVFDDGELGGFRLFEQIYTARFSDVLAVA